MPFHDLLPPKHLLNLMSVPLAAIQKSAHAEFHRFLEPPTPLHEFVRFQGTPLPLSVRTYKSSHLAPKHLLLLSISVTSKFAEFDVYPRT